MRRFVPVMCLLAAGCGGAFVPPAGPGEPAPDAARAWDEATRACRGARTYSGRLHLGVVGANLMTSVTADGDVFLGAVVAGQPRFTLWGRRDQATLLLHDDNRVVRAPAADIVDALIGAAIGPEEWLAMLTGCVTRSHDMTGAARLGKLLRIDTRDGRVYLMRVGGVWRVRGGEVNGLIIDYTWREHAFPGEIRARSAPDRSRRASIAVEASEFSVNQTLPPATFTPARGAAAATPMTLDELREAGPLRKRERDP